MQKNKEILNLSWNRFNEKGCQVVVNVIRDNPDAKILVLNACNLTTCKVKIIADALPGSHIRTLFLNWNDISSEGLAYIEEIIPKTSLTELHLSHNPCTQFRNNELPPSTEKLLRKNAFKSYGKKWGTDTPMN